MNEMFFYEIAGLIALATMLPLAVGVVTYGFFAPWWQSWLGKVTLAKWSLTLLVFVYIVIRRLLGDFPGYGYVAFALYSLFFLAYTAMAIVVIVEVRGGRTIDQRKEDNV